MLLNRIMWIIVLVGVVLTGITLVNTITNSQSRLTQTCEAQEELLQKKQSRSEFEAQFPTADYDRQEETDIAKREKRQAKNNGFDKMNLVARKPNKEYTETSIFIEQEPIDALPFTNSQLVVIGNVLDASAYLSNDKTGVYSEFSIRISEILKSNSNELKTGSIITFDREGGFVKYKDGFKRLYRIQGRNLPRPGKKYLMFLSSENKVITGYQIQDGKVFPLDEGDQFQSYRSLNASEFLNIVRNASR